MNTPAALVATAPRFILALLAAAVPLLAAGDAARAQTGVNLSTDHVTVDLSVIGDMSGAMPSGAATVAPKASQPRVGGLLVPDARMPTSRLHVAAPPAPGGGKITLRPPGSKPKKTAAAPRKPAPAKKPTPPKPAEKTAAAPPAPLTAPPKAPVTPVAPTPKDQPPAPPPAAAEPEKKPAPPAKTAEATPPVAAPAPAATEQASMPPAGAALTEGRALQVAFAGGASKLPDASKDALTNLATQIKDNETLRLQLQAYAGGSDLSASKARRLSLSRALSVRSFLIENGIRSTRIDVRALGDKTTEEPVNRVDVNIVER